MRGASNANSTTTTMAAEFGTAFRAWDSHISRAYTTNIHYGVFTKDSTNIIVKLVGPPLSSWSFAPPQLEHCQCLSSCRPSTTRIVITKDNSDRCRSISSSRRFIIVVVIIDTAARRHARIVRVQIFRCRHGDGRHEPVQSGQPGKHLRRMERRGRARHAHAGGRRLPAGAQRAPDHGVKVRFPRSASSGLGLELLELAGGREDGLGIVIVENVVAGGAADGSGILPGDSIVKVEVQRQSTSSSGALDATEADESFAVETECLGYDKTVEALQSLPPAESDDTVEDFFVITLKRLRRKPVVQVKLQYPPAMNEPDVSLELFAGENLRRALLVRGTKLNDPLAARFDSGGSGDCGAEGTCATCAVAVTQGLELLSPPGQQEAQIFQKHPRWRMTCKAVVGHGMQEGELTVRVSPRQWDKE